MDAAIRLWDIAARAAVAVAVLSAVTAVPAQAQGTVKSVHGDWQVRCDTPPGAQGEHCALIQSVIAEDRPNVVLTIIILKSVDRKDTLMRVLAPLGVLLSFGRDPKREREREPGRDRGGTLGLRIDKADIGSADFVRCLPNGCVAEVQIDENLLKQLRGGQRATFIIYPTSEEGIGIPMDLKGFSEGFDKLP